MSAQRSLSFERFVYRLKQQLPVSLVFSSLDENSYKGHKVDKGRMYQKTASGLGKSCQFPPVPLEQLLVYRTVDVWLWNSVACFQQPVVAGGTGHVVA